MAIPGSVLAAVLDEWFVDTKTDALLRSARIRALVYIPSSSAPGVGTQRPYVAVNWAFASAFAFSIKPTSAPLEFSSIDNLSIFNAQTVN